MVCTAYNADFDGDQMAVHVPLSAEAQAEARILMLSAHNILSPAHGRPVATPTQDMVLGCYYLTVLREGTLGEGKYYSNPEEAILAVDAGFLDLHAQIKVRMNGQMAETTTGRLIFNQHVQTGLGYLNVEVDKKQLGKIVSYCCRHYGTVQTAEVLDQIKRLGFHYATRSGATISVTDITIPEAKASIIAEAENRVELLESHLRRGLITPEERYFKVLEIWGKAKEDVEKEVKLALDKFNPVFMMANSGARGNFQQLSQLAGMRGLMNDPSGRTIDLPIKANFREGLSVLDFFNSTHGARKGLADTALRTADSGYLTRRLVDVAQDVIVREEDCGATDGIKVDSIYYESEFGEEQGQLIESLAERIVGRVSADDVVHPETGKIILPRNTDITEDLAEKVEQAGVKEVAIRSVLTCKTRYGVCIRCYGRNLATGRLVDVGEAVGIIAAQSIGEPGTQLTMRTFHMGGVAGDDITLGLPRVEELFEARKPKGQAIVAEVGGIAKMMEIKGLRRVVLTTDTGEEKSYQVPYGARLRVRDGARVEPGDRLTEGSANPHDILKVKGIRGVQMYVVQEVQEVYRTQSVEINDKHIEVVVRQMLRKRKVETAGDTDLLPGGLVDVFELEDENARIEAQGGEPAVARPVLLGITKASLATESFLSAASFQETTRVLTEASIKGRKDPLLGLKENVIIGKLVPAGTGMSRYRNIKVFTEPPTQTEAQ